MPGFDPCKAADRKLAEIKQAMLLSVQKESETLNINILSECSLFYWTTKEGKRLFIGDMSDSHLLNCIKQLARKGLYNPIIAYEYVRRQNLLESDSER